MHLKKKIPQSALRQSRLRSTQEYQILMSRENSQCKMCVCVAAQNNPEEITRTQEETKPAIIS